MASTSDRECFSLSPSPVSLRDLTPSFRFVRRHSLCVLDDKPRAEFSPRQRHALKEFAAIVMRELELWRDKLQFVPLPSLPVASLPKLTFFCFTHVQSSSKGHDPGLDGKVHQGYGRDGRFCSFG